MKKIILVLLTLLLVSSVFSVSRARALRHFYNLTVDNDLIIGNGLDVDGATTLDDVDIDGTFTQETYIIRKFVSQTGMVDATETAVFTITTTTAEFGGYHCYMSIMAGDDMATGNENTAVMGLDAHFVRVVENSGTAGGTTSAVAEVSQTASANEGSGAIADITMTVTDTSEIVQTINATVDVSASGVSDIVIIVELIYWDLATPPVIAGS